MEPVSKPMIQEFRQKLIDFLSNKVYLASDNKLNYFDIHGRDFAKLEEYQKFESLHICPECGSLRLSFSLPCFCCRHNFKNEDVTREKFNQYKQSFQKNCFYTEKQLPKNESPPLYVFLIDVSDSMQKSYAKIQHDELTPEVIESKVKFFQEKTFNAYSVLATLYHGSEQFEQILINNYDLFLESYSKELDEFEIEKLLYHILPKV